ncbi:PREDICTED: LOB domain-containing protein 12-like [Tarenaya hassleriana]|uniref:LOB domain-containing protein 12-like n=1 Tax=Tarenaya hassleriana TaxID=28532 RepID=UPI00053C13CD|nr:PREDICTED: LOB domain-containing protein 12-like [Tarenaya hassleriana]
MSVTTGRQTRRENVNKDNAVNVIVLLILSILASVVMTLKGSSSGAGSQACAVCKYQRRRCKKDCLLAPYFPADQPKVFQNAHRLFGVSNIQKILKDVPPDQREEAVKSIKYESFIRSRFPVHGCCEVIWHLRYQLHHATEQLRHIHGRIASLKADQFRGQTSEKPNDPMPYPDNYLADDNAFPYMPNEYNGNFEPALDMKPFDIKAHEHHHVMQLPHYNNFYDHNQIENNSNYNGNNDCIVDDNNNNTIINNHPLSLQQNTFVQHEIDDTHDYDEMSFDPLADDRHLASKETCESSAESSCFNLTTMEQTEDIRTFF